MATFQPRRYDFSALSQIGANIGQGMLNRRLRGAIGPNGEIDFKSLWEADPLTALKYKIAQDEAEALSDYRKGQLANAAVAAQPDDLALFREFQKTYGGGGAQPQPSYLGPADPSSPQGVESAPSFMFDKFATPLQKAQQKAREAQSAEEGKGAGKQATKDRFKAGLSVRVQKTLENLFKKIGQFDPVTVKNAIGPWQGAGTSTLGAAAAAPFQAWGDMINTGKGSTAEVRDFIRGQASALQMQLMPLIKTPGLGGMSDYDAQQLEISLGALANAKDVPELYRRLGDLRTTLKDTVGLDISLPELDAVLAEDELYGNKPNPYNEEGASWSEQPPMDMATDPPPATQEAASSYPPNINGKELQDTAAMRKQLDSMPDGSRIQGAGGGFAVKKNGKWYNESTGEVLE